MVGIAPGDDDHESMSTGPGRPLSWLLAGRALGMELGPTAPASPPDPWGRASRNRRPPG
jgi:hypothetical protein